MIMPYDKKKVLKLILVMSFVLIVLLTVINIKIANKAKEIEENNRIITYSYDATNRVSENLISAKLVTETFEPNKVTKNSDEWYISFEHTYFGTLELDFKEPTEAEQSISVTLSETEQDGHAWTRYDSNNELCGFGIDFYTSDYSIPSGTTKYRISLPERPLPINESVEGGWEGGVIPFYYATIKGLNCDENEVEFRQIAVHTEFNDSNSAFVSDNELLNEIYDFCKNTIKSTSYAGVYVDGYRELRPYEADAFINEMGHFSVDNYYDIDRTTIEYLVYHHAWPTEWILQTIPLAYEYYMYSGDKEFIEEIYPELERCLMQELLNEDGLIDSTIATEDFIDSFGYSAINDIVDWPQAQRDGFESSNERGVEQIAKEWGYRYKSFIAGIAGCQYASTLYSITADGVKYSNTILSTPNAVVNAFYYHGLMEMAFLSGELGFDEKQDEYLGVADSFKTVYQNSFINRETGLVTDSKESSHSSLHANMFALDFGLVPDDNISEVLSFIKSKGMACSVYGSQYLLETLFKYGEDEYAISLITSKDKNSWYNMIYNTGSKLATEAWDEDIKPDMDWNHAWGTAPVNIITRYIAGITPYSAGCDTLCFSPHFGGLENVEAIVPINNGQVDVEYSLEGVTVSINIEIPVRTLFEVPTESGDVIINGVQDDADEIWLEPGENSISYKIE